MSRTQHHATAPPATLSPAPLNIDCDVCVMRATAACGDCVVSFIIRREPGDAIVIDVDEARALSELAHGGLVPTLRHRQASSE